MFELTSEASFDAAHFLTNYKGKCENLHGHRWRVVACVGTDTLVQSGTEQDMVMDFAAFKAALRDCVASFDHTFIVERGSLAQSTLDALNMEGFKLTMVDFRTTAENFARFFADELISRGLSITRVDVYETPKNCATYYPQRDKTHLCLGPRLK